VDQNVGAGVAAADSDQVEAAVAAKVPAPGQAKIE
jgi:hypothetical protein